jgi:hypothetical protein
MNTVNAKSLHFRYRMFLGFFIFGLVVSGLTAFPLLHEIRVIADIVGIDDVSRWTEYSGLRKWVAYICYGLERTYADFPFVGYGTDWLAFGHLVIALFFVKPWLEPGRHDWVLRCGILSCVAVVPFAIICGEIRGIPLFWRAIDCSFGVVGLVPLFYCLRLSSVLKRSCK